MTDNEIKKALECCIAPNCGVCPIFNNKEIRKVPGRCVVTLEKYALDLINRQSAEIDKLTYQVNRLKKYDEERDIRLHTRLTATARAEAIKEFAERLKPIVEDGYVVDIIDSIVKEMVGES